MISRSFKKYLLDAYDGSGPGDVVVNKKNLYHHGVHNLSGKTKHENLINNSYYLNQYKDQRPEKEKHRRL